MALGARINEDRSLGRLLKDLSTDTVTLIRQEIDLAKTEISENIAQVGAMGRAVAIGAGLAVAGGLALLAALVLGLTSLLSEFLSPWVAMWLGPLIVGLLLAGIGFVMIRTALASHRQSLVPRKTAESLQENQEWLKSKIR
jgi:Putative Actinobacterial Holin-X, holin superfamily III